GVPYSRRCTSMTCAGLSRRQGSPSLPRSARVHALARQSMYAQDRVSACALEIDGEPVRADSLLRPGCVDRGPIVLVGLVTWIDDQSQYYYCWCTHRMTPRSAR